MLNTDYKYIDVHSHLQFAAFDGDREEVLRRTLGEDTWMINVGTQYDTSKNAALLANKYKEGVYATVALHPIHTSKSHHDIQELGEWGASFVSRGEEFNYENYKKLAINSKVVGIGECGLDYYHLEDDTIAKQKKVFEEHIQLANEVGKPLMLHIRSSSPGGANAYKDAAEILNNVAKVKGDVHFFAGTTEDAKRFLDMGFTISFTGVITFLPVGRQVQEGRADYEELIKYVPVDMILSETDNPYVAPVPLRGRRNEPSYVKFVVNRIAEVKGLPEEKTAEIIFNNAKRVFGL
ncbi:MAG: TatD family hydrolase [Candidatus Vogelbacteria bacterium]|nr:TatD family hydrolase [Candidatus Vogelbacteria bacterium]